MYLGDFLAGATVRFTWDSVALSGGSITRGTNGTIHVYRDLASGTEVTAGVTDTEDFDSLTGIHACSIDLTADALYAAGHDYVVILKASTIDGQTVNATLAHFSIENRSHNAILAAIAGYLDTEIADIRNRLPAALVGGRMDASVGAMAANVMTAAAAAADLTTELQSGLATSTNVSDAQAAILAKLPAALVGGRIDASVGAMAAGVLTDSAIAANAITDAKVAADVTIASVTGAVGSVAGDVGGNVTGSIGSLATQAKADVNAEVLAVVDPRTDAIEADTQDLQNRMPAALVSGRMDASVGAMAANVMTAAAAADDLTAELQSGLATAAALAAVEGKVDTIKGKTDNLPGPIRKNVAIAKFVFAMKNTDGSPGTGLTVTTQISQDGGAFATLAGAVTEMSGGYYWVAFLQAEANADVIAFKATAPGAQQRDLTIFTQP